MFGNLLLERLVMEGELVRVAIAIIGTALATWYDVINNKNIPNKFLYIFLAVAFLINLIFFSAEVSLYGFVVAAAIFLLGYIFYRLGYVGGADVYVLTAIALLMPVFPSWVPVLFNFPPALSIIITSGVLFALYFLYFIITNIVLKGKKGKWEYFILVPVWAIMIYFLISTGIFDLPYILVVSILILSSVVFMAYKEPVIEAMAEKVPLAEVDEEDIAVLELMPELAKKHKISRLLDSKELARLKKAGVKEIYVYKKLPPFLPFLFAGLLVAVIIGDILMHAIKV